VTEVLPASDATVYRPTESLGSEEILEIAEACRDF